MPSSANIRSTALGCHLTKGKLPNNSGTVRVYNANTLSKHTPQQLIVHIDILMHHRMRKTLPWIDYPKDITWSSQLERIKLCRLLDHHVPKDFEDYPYRLEEVGESGVPIVYYYEMFGYDPPSDSFGYPGDIYIDIHPGSTGLYTRFDEQWRFFTYPDLRDTWGNTVSARIRNYYKATHPYQTSAHPHLSDRFLWLADDQGAGVGYLPLESIHQELLMGFSGLHSDPEVSEVMLRRYLRILIKQKGLTRDVEYDTDSD